MYVCIVVVTIYLPPALIPFRQVETVTVSAPKLKNATKNQNVHLHMILIHVLYVMNHHNRDLTIKFNQESCGLLMAFQGTQWSAETSLFSGIYPHGFRELIMGPHGNLVSHGADQHMWGLCPTSIIFPVVLNTYDPHEIPRNHIRIRFISPFISIRFPCPKKEMKSP